VSYVSPPLALTRGTDDLVKNLVLVGFANIEIVSRRLLFRKMTELISRSTWILSIYLI
jgi:hypothetical protein